LLIKQDCQKAIRMIRYCLAEQNNDRFKRQQEDREIKSLHRRIAYFREELQALQQDLIVAQVQDQQVHAQASAWASSMNITVSANSSARFSRAQAVQARIAQKQQEIQKCELELARFPKSYTCSYISTPLARLFADRSREAVVDASHEQYNITIADILDHLPLLESIVAFIHMHMFEVRWEYVKGHQTALSTCDRMQDNEDDDASSPQQQQQHKYSQADHRGNDSADALAKEGSRQCSVLEHIAAPSV
jgi:hypothetical protein